MWHMTCEMWHLAPDMWHVTMCQNIRSLALTVCKLWCFEDFFTKDDRLTDLRRCLWNSPDYTGSVKYYKIAIMLKNLWIYAIKTLFRNWSFSVICLLYVFEALNSLIIELSCGLEQLLALLYYGYYIISFLLFVFVTNVTCIPWRGQSFPS